MRKEKVFNLLTLILVSIIAGVICISHWRLVEPIKIGNLHEKTYSNAIVGFSFKYPSAFRAVERIGVGDIGFVDVFWDRPTNVVSPYFIEISFQPSIAGKSLSNQAMDYLPGIRKEDLIPLVRSGIQGLQYVSNRGAEKSIYNFFVANNYFIVFKFNQRYFDKTNPLVLIDNTLYYGTYSNILDSLRFDDRS
jgi:hypothetical protein